MTTPPGWYDDGRGALRWWSGDGWTEHVQQGALPSVAASVAPPARTGSRLWILWLVIGIVVIGIVAAAVAIVPRLMALAEGSNVAAVAAVDLYDHAWQQVDCAEYQEATTASFRADDGFASCDAFEQQAQAFSDATDAYLLTVTGVERSGEVCIVETSETYSRLVDDSGAPLDEPEPIEDVYRYTVVSDSGAWRIDEIE